VLRLQNTILDLIARGETLEATAARICIEIEAELPGVTCSVLRLDRAGSLRPLAAPSLPEAFAAAIDGVRAGADVGSCGGAAYLGVPVTVTDIATDPRWRGYEELILAEGLKACWSRPIKGADGAILGTFALYFTEKRGPNAREEAVVDACVALCTIALERYDRLLGHERRAYTDVLTDLPNRAGFNSALAGLSCTDAGAWALLMIDLDNLKTINDTFGHDAGDELLQAVATRIATAMAPDPVFRLGGDEFAVLVQTPDALADLDGSAQHILTLLDEPADCGGHMIIPRATIGCAALAAGDERAEAVRRHADFALYHAKETGRGGFVQYWPGIGSAMTHRINVIRDVDAALREGLIDAHYQPVVRLDTGEIVGMEALCRLVRPDGEIIPAAAFHQATADVHVASDLTQRMMAIVAADVRSWVDRGIPFQHVGINISSADLHRGTLHDRLRAIFDAAQVPLKHVILEITESVYLGQRDPIIARQIEALRARGLRVALDDFGTGFASLTHLLSVPIDVIKIDKSFVDRLKPGDPSIAIVEGLIQIARKLGIRVIAEGIEREDQATLLRQFGCKLGQGYMFSSAVPREIAFELLARFSQKPGRIRSGSMYGLPDRPTANPSHPDAADRMDGWRELAALRTSARRR
jgi:diguanylate cyclase (GGDEF)-like protein